ncbi:MAG: VOC family protein [Dehalococcoidia bacterium]|nr:VOC family protein [Dehalococcoidia bacterium]
MPDFRYHHLHLISPDPLKTSEFYENILGARRISFQKIETGAMINLELGGAIIGIMPPRKQRLIPAAVEPVYGIEHFGLRTDNLEQSVAELKARGVTFARDIIAPMPGFKTSFLVAPENVLVELFEGSA